MLRSLGKPLALAAYILGAPPSVAQVDDERAAALFVANALQAEIQELSDKNWNLRQGFLGHVDKDSAFSHNMRVDRGDYFIVKGHCDRECSDMDLELLDSNGTVIVSDQGVDDTPEIRIRRKDLPASGARVRVRMYECVTNVCYYSVGVFSR